MATNEFYNQAFFNDIIGESDAMKRAIKLAFKGAQTSVPILLEGESGVGKEIFAKAIHRASDRSEKPFVVVNCGAIPENLVESILFGHAKGAFTDAKQDHAGKFVEADGGIIFLDEIGELPLSLQVKLLRVIQEGEVDPIGSPEVIKIDVRLISATNKNLEKLTMAGQFREDLFYRLNVFPISLPSLRSKDNDVRILASYFIDKICQKEGRTSKSISNEAEKLLNSYDWPGNVRQLENAIVRAVILSDNEAITEKDFPQIVNEIEQEAALNRSHKRRQDDHARPDNIPNDFVNTSIYDENGDVYTMEKIEEIMIKYAFMKYEGKMSEIARRLSIGRSTLYRKATALGLLDDVK